MSIHIGLGFFVLWFVLWRTGWRLAKGFPSADTGSRLERIAAGAMHRALLAVLLVMVVTGFCSACCYIKKKSTLSGEAGLTT